MWRTPEPRTESSRAVQGAAAIRTAGRSGTAQTACPKGIAPERRSSRHNAIRWRAGSAGSRGNNSSHRHSRSKCSAFTPRPYQTHPWLLVLASRTSDFSFPSDHAVMAGAVAAGLLLVSRLTGPTPREIGGRGADYVRRTRRDDRGDRTTRRCCASRDDHRRTPDGVRGGAVVCRSNQPSGGSPASPSSRSGPGPAGESQHLGCQRSATRMEGEFY